MLAPRRTSPLVVPQNKEERLLQQQQKSSGNDTSDSSRSKKLNFFHPRLMSRCTPSGDTCDQMYRRSRLFLLSDPETHTDGVMSTLDRWTDLGSPTKKGALTFLPYSHAQNSSRKTTSMTTGFTTGFPSTQRTASADFVPSCPFCSSY